MNLTITDEAKLIILKARALKQVPDEFFIRIGVQRGGCAGIAHQLGFDEMKEGDNVYIFNGLEVIINIHHQPFLENLCIDYAQVEEINRNLPFDGLRFKNPSAVRVCGCGNSFNVI